MKYLMGIAFLSWSGLMVYAGYTWGNVDEKFAHQIDITKLKAVHANTLKAKEDSLDLLRADLNRLRFIEDSLRVAFEGRRLRVWR